MRINLDSTDLNKIQDIAKQLWHTGVTKDVETGHVAMVCFYTALQDYLHSQKIELTFSFPERKHYDNGSLDD